VLLLGDERSAIVYAPDGAIVESEIVGASAQEAMVKAMQAVDEALKGRAAAAD